ncbi:uncharacterized protein C8Q71DRAFT_310817 [Rhodofomes roseus]|uniref:Topoisomerase 6 subunit A/Spo11 TOPRIM domain-containing protein n=1 Tax=Rhodofomes roseus TaxID=34475 RepID=A0ABQ8K356_9APHY|nr:uncharacterized protein C8Q71DRAFT_310817 [Rhodofomes roseus]KAH9831233.1 hypothetical protein C8Q71DRAFT_310817 [Rhodofomes roseus]
MRHERESLAAGRVRWLGLWTSELAGLGISRDALIPITKHDAKKALSMLRRSALPKKWRKELQYMLHNRRKAEIEILSSVQRKPTASGSRRDLGRQSGDMLDSVDYEDLATASGHIQPPQPPCLVTYLTDKINAIVVSYAAKYS